jgi:hypothetical protein
MRRSRWAVTADRQLTDEILEQGIRNASRWCAPKVRARATGRQSVTHARANRLTPTPPGARQPDGETGTDPVMGRGELASSIQRPSASAPAQRNHESTTKFGRGWAGRQAQGRRPGDRQLSAKEHAGVLDALFEHLVGDLRVGHHAGHLQRPHRQRVEPERLRAR